MGTRIEGKGIWRLLGALILALCLTGCGTRTAGGEADFLPLAEQAQSGEVTEALRVSFNHYARENVWCYLPVMDGYESFFSVGGYSGTWGYPLVSEGIFYELMHHFEQTGENQLTSETAEERLREDFASYSDEYQAVDHQDFGRLAIYADGVYTLPPEGTLDMNRMYYYLSALTQETTDEGRLLVTVVYTPHYFEDTAVYEPGEAEQWLRQYEERYDCGQLAAADKTLAAGEMGELTGRQFMAVLLLNAETDSAQILRHGEIDLEPSDGARGAV